MFNNRYDTDHFAAHVDTRGYLACAGLGYGLGAWQASLRLQAGMGYWWEEVEVDYLLFYGDAPFVVDNDEPAMFLLASLAFPFTDRLNTLISFEFVARPEQEFDGSFENGRSYQLITNRTYGTVSIGLTMGLGS